MKKIESSLIKEQAYIEKLQNGLTIIIIPKNITNKKYMIYGTKFGSIDNHFILPTTGEEIQVPDGVAHYLEHKMFEQENGKNSLDVLMALGVDANAYTTNDHTAYLFECTNNFHEALTELMDYVQHPYFTEENIEKERGIIGQEIKMYDDEPSWKLYMNAMDCLYHKNPIKIDIAGTQESISKIDKKVLYDCYNTFYHPSNMVLVLCGNFEVTHILEEIKNHLVDKASQANITRIYPKEEKGINKKYKEAKMEVSQPIFMIGFKDENKSEEQVKKHIAIEILLNMIAGKSSKLYKNLYEKQLIFSSFDLDYEFSSQYAHVLIAGQSKNPELVKEELVKQIEEIKKDMNEAYFLRIKKKVYGDYVSEYNSVGNIARMFLSDMMKGVQTFDYIEQFKSVNIEYAKKILNEIFNEKNMIMSVIKPKN